MKKLTVILLGIIMCLALLVGCGKTDANTADTDGTDASTGPVAVDSAATAFNEKDNTYTIETPFADLKYPVKWRDVVKVETDDARATFTTADVKLFDVVVGKAEGGILLGTILSDDGNTVLSYVGYDIAEDAENFDELCEMQEDINTIIKNLETDYDFVVGSAVNEEEIEVFAIETSVVTLYYPTKWQDKVTVDVKDDAVTFSAEDNELFKIIFTKDDGIPLGEYAGTPISVLVSDIDGSSMSEEEFEELCAMQEDYNVILKNLMRDKDFELYN